MGPAIAEARLCRGAVAVYLRALEEEKVVSPGRCRASYSISAQMSRGSALEFRV